MLIAAIMFLCIAALFAVRLRDILAPLRIKTDDELMARYTELQRRKAQKKK